MSWSELTVAGCQVSTSLRLVAAISSSQRRLHGLFMSPEECTLMKRTGMADDDGNRGHFISAGERLQARPVNRKVGMDEDLFKYTKYICAKK